MQIKSKLKYLNLGCGERYHPDWTNIDFNSSVEDVIKHNLLKGLPFHENSFSVVYHSHVLEHFVKNDAERFIKECHRVLETNGIIRIAVPDLEIIAKLYLQKLAEAEKGVNNAQDDYDWMMLELYDQSVRTIPGGEMQKTMQKEGLANLDFIEQRMGGEFSELGKAKSSIKISKRIRKTVGGIKRSLLKSIHHISSLSLYGQYINLGQFRMSGEIHQWMYDKFSLARLLQHQGFKDVQTKSAFESSISNWESFGLDVYKEQTRKPDSLFIEARK